MHCHKVERVTQVIDLPTPLIGFYFDPVTGALKILATGCTDFLPAKRSPYTIDLLEDSQHTTPVNQQKCHWEIDYRKIIEIYWNFDGKLLHRCSTTVSEVIGS